LKADRQTDRWMDGWMDICDVHANQRESEGARERERERYADSKSRQVPATRSTGLEPSEGGAIEIHELVAVSYLKTRSSFPL
jgi:hypothetical protein